MTFLVRVASGAAMAPHHAAARTMLVRDAGDAGTECRG